MAIMAFDSVSCLDILIDPSNVQYLWSLRYGNNQTNVIYFPSQLEKYLKNSLQDSKYSCLYMVKNPQLCVEILR